LLRATEHGVEELLASILRTLLRVVEIRERPHAMLLQRRVVEEDARDDERSRERSASRLVDTGDEACAELAVESQKPLAGPLHSGESSALLGRCDSVFFGHRSLFP